LLEIIKKVPDGYDVTISNFCEWFFQEPKAVSFINPVNYFNLVDNENAYEIDSYFFDGILAQKWLGLLLKKSYQRMSFDFTSLAPLFFAYCEKNYKTIYILGAKEQELQSFLRIIRKTYPKLSIIGSHNGYFSCEEYISIRQQISELRPDVVICGMGCPKQEEVAVDIRTLSSSTSSITCGGFIHQTQNNLHYYPGWINRLGLRMPYRFIKEPHTRRRLSCYPRFLLRTLLAKKD
jgi:exopolysaccharide biosynthesis WecB/TagA/CpsF family protein